ncbi:MAG TPA: amino acid permease [Steroidobacteraceae bacterium]|jgi:APA family basic amino acid/polyamine antiporter|nr:amino acid permease [Steroidobacteraceae bacterium]
MPTDGALKRDVRLIDVVTLGAGAAIGVAMFSIFSPAVQLAGPAMLVSLVLAAVPMALFAVVYAFLGSAVPSSGAAFVWQTRFLHPFVGFIIAWTRILGSVGVMVVLALVLVQHWTMLVPLPLKPTMLIVFVVFYLLNLFGISIAARVQTLLFCLMGALLLGLVALGLPAIDSAHFEPFMPRGWLGLFAAIPLLVSLFLGIESATEVGDEIRDARRVIARGIAISVGVTLVIYCALSVVVVGTVDRATLGASTTPLLLAAERVMGPYASYFIILAATLAITKSLNAILIIFSRYLFAMARSGMLPGALARVHARWGTPHVALTVAFACCVLGLLMPMNLVFLFLAVNIPTMLKYFASCLAALRVVGRHGHVYDDAGFKPGKGLLRVLSIAGALCALAIIAVGVEADWRPYVVLSVWALAGVLYWCARPRAVAGEVS